MSVFVNSFFSYVDFLAYFCHSKQSIYFKSVLAFENQIKLPWREKKESKFREIVIKCLKSSTAQRRGVDNLVSLILPFVVRFWF